ncbi:MAG: endonuclease MutS2 [Chloroflexota bacterium]
MDEKSIEILEFPRIREKLASLTSFSASRELALSLLPLSDYSSISLLLEQSAEARRLLEQEDGFSIGGVQDVRGEVRLAARGKVLEPQTLVAIQDTLAAVRKLRTSLGRLSEEFPRLWDIAQALVELRPLEKSIGGCLTPGGEFLDSASPKLEGVRHRIREAREQLTQRLEAIIKSPRMQKIIQEPVITEREGRYVIPVRIELRAKIRGIVHDVSNTGATAFVEPWATVELGNGLRELVTEENREMERLLRQLSAEVGSQQEELCGSIARVAEIDLALAKARYARQAGAVEATLAPVSGGKPVLRPVEARHPLLLGKAVPLSVELGNDFLSLVITGPNTGGKTVALKTIGLLSLMTQAGLPVPASGDSTLPVFDNIFADIGDEQSIEQTLSTFSWHIGNIIRIIKGATGNSLVLLDELGTSTDPVEGSALARANLLYFLERGSLTVATTHFSELKAFAHTTPGLQNASLDFDPVTLAPTYHLTVGVPGGSNAIATAARLGLPPEIISTAKGMLSRSAQELETLLTDLAGEKQRTEALRHQLEERQKGIEGKSVELEQERERLKAEERRLVREARDRVVREAAELHKVIRQAAADLKKEKTRERVEQARRELAAVQSQLRSPKWQVETAPGEKAEGIAVGDTVWLKDANLLAKVLMISEEKQEVEVQAGQTRLRLSLDSVQKREPPEGKTASAPPPVVREVVSRRVSPELDLRGKRAEEVEWTLERYLNDAHLAGLGEVRLIHGFGTGTVRRLVRDLLATYPLVKSFRAGAPSEGGDGATVVRL